MSNASISNPPPSAIVDKRGASELLPRSDAASAWARAARFSFVLAAIALFVVASSQPWWFFRLYAPQYPHGLTLIISLEGLSGDVREIDMLNHYIGMAHLDTAARFEREYAAYGVAALAGMLLGLAFLTRRKSGYWLGLVGALFPVLFVADSFYWLYRFGHQLDRHAPLHLPTFTPQLFGNGTIGQFMTFARPELGFWLAVAGVALLCGADLAKTFVSKHAS